MHKQTDWIQSWKACVDSVRKWCGDLRILSVLLLVFVFEWTLVQPVRDFCIQQQLSISCWFYPVLFSKTINTIFFYFGILLLFCNAPFVDNEQMYVILRIGSKNWFRGKIIYIFLTSAVYFLLMFFVCILEFVPYVGFSTHWESVMTSLSIVSTGEGGAIPVPRELITNYSPIQANLLCYLLNVLIGVMLGLLIFVINLYQTKMFGVGSAMILVLMTGFVNIFSNRQQRVILLFSPVSWSNLEVFTRDYGGISISYSFAILGITISGLIFWIMRRQRFYNIEAMEEI